MFEPRITQHLASLQVRVRDPQGPEALGIEAHDQDLYHVIANDDGMKRLRRVARWLSRTIDQDGGLEVREVIKELGDRLGGTPGIAAYRGIGIDQAPEDDPDDVWLDSHDTVTRLSLLHYTRFWVIPTREKEAMLIRCSRGMRDRLLFTLADAVDRLGYRAAIMWHADGHYVGLGYRHPQHQRPVFVDRPLDARNELSAIREMGLTPDPVDSHWVQRFGRAVRSWMALE